MGKFDNVVQKKTFSMDFETTHGHGVIKAVTVGQDNLESVTIGEIEMNVGQFRAFIHAVIAVSERAGFEVDWK